MAGAFSHNLDFNPIFSQRTRWIHFIFLGFFFYKSFLHSCEQELIEVEMKISNGLPLVLIQIENMSYFLILDFGAEKSSLNQELMTKHQFKETARIYRTVNVHGTLSTSQIYVADHMHLGNFSCKDLELITYVSDKNHLAYPVELERGVIGRECFRDQVVAIDAESKKILIGDSWDQLLARYEDNIIDWVKLSLNRQQGMILKVIDEGKEKNFLVDTGSNCSLIHDPCLKKQPITSSLATIFIPVETSSHIFLGNHFFLKANLSSLGVDGIIGFDFLRLFLIVFDFKNDELFLVQVCHL